MAVIFYDAFDETFPGSDLTSHSPDTGTSWTTLSQSSTGTLYVGGSGTFGLVNANPGGSSMHHICTADATYSTADYFVEAQVQNPDNADDTTQLCVRVQDINNMYAVQFNESTFQLYKCVSGTWTALGSDLGALVVADDVIKLEISGTTLTAYVNDVSKASETVTDHASAGKAALSMGNLIVSTHDMSGQRLYDFNVETISSGAVEVTPTVISSTFSIQEPTATGAATVSPSVITSTLSVQEPVVTGKALVSHTVITSTFSIQEPTISAGVTISPSVITSTFSIQEPTVTGGALILPTVIDATFSIQEPVIGIKETVSPNVITATFSILEPVITTTGTIEITPLVLEATFSINDPVVVGRARAYWYNKSTTEWKTDAPVDWYEDDEQDWHTKDSDTWYTKC